MSVDPRLLDKNWRLNHLYKIVNKAGQTVNFNLNNVQAELHKNKHTRNIILKARQQGLTTYECIDGLDDALFQRNFTMVIIAHEKDAVKKIFKKIKFAWDNFPAELKSYMGYTESTDSINELAFNNGSSIRVALSSRADTVSRLHISEFGKICAKYPQKAEEIITGAIPSVPENGRIDIESTAEGEFGAFHDMFWQAWNNPPLAKKQFKAFFFPWTQNPEYVSPSAGEIPAYLREYQAKHHLSDAQINWYFIELGSSKDKIKQEYPTVPEEAFEASGFKLFSAEALQQQTPTEGTKIGDWTIFKEYKPSHRYGVGGDVAEGVGQDSSTAQVIDFTTNEQVAVYESNTIAPDMFAHELRWAANRYGGCLIAPERNNHGHATIATLKTFPEVNIYQEEILDQAINRKTVKLGWLTTGASKPLMLYELNEAINSNALKIYDKSTLTELRTYDKQDLSVTRFDPEQTKHWDRVMACFVKGTMILTETGQRPIESIVVGDLVMTRSGLKPVIATACHLKPTITNIGLTGTFDHPVFCNDNQTKELLRVSESDILYIWDIKKEQIERKSFTEASFITDTQTLKGETIGSISEVVPNGRHPQSICIERSGWTIMEKSQKALLFITKMKTLLTTLWKTWRSFHWLNIHVVICKIQKSKLNLVKRLKIIEKGLIKAFANIIKINCLKALFAEHAAKFSGDAAITTNIAQKYVGMKKLMPIKDSQSKREPVLSAKTSSKQQQTRNGVLPCASSSDGEKLTPVYNLEVADCPEYFANNILVHNCAIAWQMRKVFVPVPDTSEDEAISNLLNSIGERDPYHRDIGTPRHKYEEKRAVHDLLADFTDKE